MYGCTKQRTRDGGQRIDIIDHVPRLDVTAIAVGLKIIYLHKTAGPNESTCSLMKATT